jgi:hypothetical protein
MKNMKKLVLLFTALLSVAVLNSCSDDDSDNNNTTTTSSITVANLRAYVGQSNSQISSSIIAKGYTLTSSEVQENGAKTYAYTSSTSGAACAIIEYNNIIFSASYTLVGTDQTSQLSSFKTLSNEAYSIYTSIVHDYSSTILTSESQEFTSHQNFISAINSSTGILSCMEAFNVLNQEGSPTSITQLMYLSSDIASKGFSSASVSYTDYTIPSPLAIK